RPRRPEHRRQREDGCEQHDGRLSRQLVAHEHEQQLILERARSTCRRWKALMLAHVAVARCSLAKNIRVAGGTVDWGGRLHHTLPQACREAALQSLPLWGIRRTFS